MSMTLSGCAAPSVLIPADDSTFNYAQKRLSETSKRVYQSGAAKDEEVLFLQAESFYRYRFNPQRQTTHSYMLEAAAAITDFPGFQAFSGSLSLLDMRERAADSAVQLWESLLKNSPNSKLKPLTLYRLGWAYRNTSAEGLPREDPKDAFDELIKTDPDSDLAHLASEAENVEWKSKTAAAERSLLPGLGQLYVGETRNGILRLSIAVAAAAAVAIPFYIAAHRGEDLKWDRDWPLLATGLGGLIVLSFDYTSSYQDSMRGVTEWNERAERKFEESHPHAP